MASPADMKPPGQSEAAIFEAALVCVTPEQRVAYLDRACAGQPELRRRVEALLAADSDASGFLENAPAPAPEAPPREPYAAPGQPAKAGTPNSTVRINLPAEETLGAMIGRYKLLEKVGEGGFGAVYVAEQREPVKRRVALKIIKLGMDTRQVVARFEAERQALAMMDHPNIAKVLDAGATDMGRPFFVMELVRGIKFTDYCDQNKLSTEERLQLFVKVCQAIQHAHQKGIIHRDIKPSNILVTLHDGVPVPKVIDFGIAKATQGELTDKTVYTQLQQFIGTPAYMSPEQAEMSGLDVDTRSDIYSLGVLLYELLTGRTPFDQKQLMEAGLDAMRKMIREEEPMRPSTRISSLKGEDRTTTAARRHTEAPKLIHMLRGDLDWIVMKALEKDRTRRYETANGLAMDVQRYLSNEPIVARPPSRIYRFQKLARRNKLAFAAAAAIFFALLAGTTVSTWQAIRATRAQREAETMARFIREDLFNQSTPDESAPEGVRNSMAEVLKRATDKLNQNAEILRQPKLEATLRHDIGSTYYKLGFWNEAETQMSRAVSLRKTALGPDHPETLAAQEDLAWLWIGCLRKFDEGEKLSRETWQARARVLGRNDTNTLESKDSYGTALTSQKKYEEAEPIYREILAARERLLGPVHKSTLISLGNLAVCLTERSQFAEAEMKFKDVIARSESIKHPESPDLLARRLGYGLTLFLQGRDAEAISTLRDARSRALASCGPEHPATWHLQHALARVLTVAGRLDEAEKLARETLERRRAKLPTHEGTGRTAMYLGHILVAKGKLDDAEPYLRDAHTLFRERYPKKLELAAEAANWLGAIQVARTNYAEAESLMLPGVEPILARTSGLSLKEQRTLLGHLVKLYEAWGKHDEAAAWRKKVDLLAGAR